MSLGRFAPACANPFRALEVGPLPAGEHEALEAAFAGAAASLGLVPDSEEWVAAWTFVRWGWRMSWMHGLRCEAAAVRREMGR